MGENDFKVNLSDDDLGVVSDSDSSEEMVDAGGNAKEQEAAELAKKVEAKMKESTKEDPNKNEDLSANAFQSMAQKGISVDKDDLDMDGEDKVSLEIIKNMKNKRKKQRQLMVGVYSLVGVLVLGLGGFLLANNVDMLASLFAKKEVAEEEKNQKDEENIKPAGVATTDDEDDKTPVIVVTDNILEVEDNVTEVGQNGNVIVKDPNGLIKLDQTFLNTPERISFYEIYKRDFGYIQNHNTSDRVKEYYLRRINLLIYDWKEKGTPVAYIKKRYSKIMPAFQNDVVRYEEYREEKLEELKAKKLEEMANQPEEQPVEDVFIEEQPIEGGTGTIEEPVFIEEQPIEGGTGTIEEPIFIEEQPVEGGTGTIEEPVFIEEQPVEGGTGTIEEPVFIEEQPVEGGTGTIEEPIFIEEQPVEGGTGTIEEPVDEFLPWDNGSTGTGDDFDELEELTLPWEE